MGLHMTRLHMTRLHITPSTLFSAPCSALIIALLSLSAVWAPRSAEALSMAPYTFKELWSESQVVARGAITATRVYRDRGRVWTEFTITLTAQPLKDTRGDTKAPVKFVMPGGTIDGITQMVPGVPRLKRGQELVVFLRCRARSTCAPVGFGQGLWSPNAGGQWAPMTQGVEWVGSGSPSGALTLDQLTTDPNQATPAEVPSSISQ